MGFDTPSQCKACGASPLTLACHGLRLHSLGYTASIILGKPGSDCIPTSRSLHADRPHAAGSQQLTDPAMVKNAIAKIPTTMCVMGRPTGW